MSQISEKAIETHVEEVLLQQSGWQPGTNAEWEVLPCEAPDDPFNDPIIRANDLKNAGERAEAEKDLDGAVPGGPALSRCPFPSG